MLTRDGVRAIRAQLYGAHWLLASPMYDPGMRRMAASRLRIKEGDPERLEITIRQNKGANAPADDAHCRWSA